MIQREIESADRAIDALVYELYGLSEAEIRIVEGKEYALPQPSPNPADLGRESRRDG
jgi:hypothetical protein